MYPQQQLWARENLQTTENEQSLQQSERTNEQMSIADNAQNY